MNNHDDLSITAPEPVDLKLLKSFSHRFAVHVQFTIRGTKAYLLDVLTPRKQK